MDNSETKNLLQAILHRVEVNGAKIESMDTRLASVEEKVDRIEGHMMRQDRRIDDHNHRIADISQLLWIDGVETIADLRERHFGSGEGWTHKEVAARFPDGIEVGAEPRTWRIDGFNQIELLPLS